MYAVQPPAILRKLYTNGVWRMNALEKKIYLTFDDGPIPEVTPWVLDVLKTHAVPATFFCVGENIKNHTAIFQRILNEHHAVGNHTYNHVDGWDTPLVDYMKNIEECAKHMDTKLFRPPYGRIRKKQKEAVSQHYSIIMWDVLSGDFDRTITKERCLRNVLDNTQPGSIIVFHDSVKAADRMQYALPRVLEYYSEKKFTFSALTIN